MSSKWKHGAVWKQGAANVGYLEFGPWGIRLLVLWGAPCDALRHALDSLQVAERRDPEGFEALSYFLEEEHGSSEANYIPLASRPATHVICFAGSDTRSPRFLGALAHECLHIIVAAFKYRGLHLSDGSEEAYAYTLSQMVSETLELLN